MAAVIAIFVGFLFSCFGFEIEEIIFAVGGIVIALIFIFLLLISPTHYIFTNEKLVICHPFKRREIILWEDVTGTMSFGSWFRKSLFGLPHYKIYYRHKKEIIFLNGEICRSRRTKKLLKKYYKGNVK